LIGREARALAAAAIYRWTVGIFNFIAQLRLAQRLSGEVEAVVALELIGDRGASSGIVELSSQTDDAVQVLLITQFGVVATAVLCLTGSNSHVQVAALG
jgi:ActR/RegA family two-component response regulator